ncbi:MAG: arylsulfatase [Planctomycetes bacterium]|nr:arylsulfatase [Planctomycetota bacterium]
MINKRTLICTAIMVMASCFACASNGTESKKRANIVLIMGDDIGFSDLGVFGGEIETPNLDRLAMQGMRFTNGYNMAKCNPTRSSMLTGLFIGNKRAQSLGTLMGKSGYRTLYSGKEHFDTWVPDSCTAMLSFQKSFAHYAGAGNYFEYNPVKFYLNEKKLSFEEIETTSKPYYKTNAITDYAIRFLDETKNEDDPFFLYIPYESAHYPLQALLEDIAKFRGRYKRGWDVLRAERFARQKELGLFDSHVQLSPAMGLSKKAIPYKPWSELTAKEQDDLDLEMAVFAAMVHCLDRNIGRLITKLEEMNELDNTLIMFLSDNGSCAYDKNRNSLPPGDPKSFRTLSSAWANVGNTPFRYFKQYGHEGGSKTHLIAHWPDVINPKSICRDITHVVDFMPTFLDMAGGTYPEVVDGKPTPLLDGTSMLPLFQGKSRPVPDMIISGWTESKRMIRQGDWKLVKPEGGGWELYNLEKDVTELNDLAKKMPEKCKHLLDLYAKWRAARPDLPLKQDNKSSKVASSSKNKKALNKGKKGRNKKKGKG